MITINFTTQKAEQEFNDQLARIYGPLLYSNSPIIILPEIPVTTAKPSFVFDFAGKPDGLLTSEYANWNPTDTKAKRSPDFEMDSGSLFIKGGFGYTGPLEEGKVDINSEITNSRVFRLVTTRRDFVNVSVKTGLVINAQSFSLKWPAVAWDGVHIFLRYKSEQDLYYASICRRDGTCIVKKKRAGGPRPENGGTYTELSSYKPRTWKINTLQNIEASIKNTREGFVLIRVSVDGLEIINVVDNGKIGTIAGAPGNWGEPITTPGGIGLRGDNSEFTFGPKLVVDPI